MNRIAGLIMTITVVFPATIYSDTIQVPADYPTIQQAIEASVNGDTVLVAPGMYVENIDFLGKAITVKSSDGAEETVIDGSNPPDPDNGCVVTFRTGEGVDSMVEGFTLRGGSGTLYENVYFGGGIICIESAPTITKNIIIANSAGSFGGGICSLYSSPTIKNNTITENYSGGKGGGIYCFGPDSPMVSNNIITDNSTFLNGGGIYCNNSSAAIADNTIAGNSAYRGSGIWCYSFNSIIRNNSIHDNTADIEGGGIYCDTSSPVIRNNIINANQATRGGGICCKDSISTITSNNISGNTGNRGIGIHIFGSSATIFDNLITENRAPSWSGDGGGIYCKAALLTLTNNTISHNSTGLGGGIFCRESPSSAIASNTIMNNTARSLGGGIYCEDCDPSIRDNLLICNSSFNRYSDGGGLYCMGSSPTIVNNIIADNSAVRSGGGICCRFDSSPSITNNTISENSVASVGGGIYCWNSSPTAINSIFWNNTAAEGMEIGIGGSSSYPSTLTISYSDVRGGQIAVHVDSGCTLDWGYGMIIDDPLFVGPDDNDFHLTYDSPCRDTGDNSAVTEFLDFEGDPRIAWSGTVDMGADEFHTHLYCTGDATPGGKVAAKFIGLPGTFPVGLWFGAGILDPPQQSIYGPWYLEPPWVGPVILGPIPSPSGLLILPATIHRVPPPPYDLLMQALIGLNADSLTNLYVVEVM